MRLHRVASGRLRNPEAGRLREKPQKPEKSCTQNHCHVQLLALVRHRAVQSTDVH